MQQWIYARCLFLMVKYWTRYNVLFFINRYLCAMWDTVGALKDRSGFRVDNAVDVDDRLFCMMLFMASVCRKAKQFGMIRSDGRALVKEITEPHSAEILKAVMGMVHCISN